MAYGKDYCDKLGCLILVLITTTPQLGVCLQYEDTTSKELGHSRDSNGSITWGPLPRGYYHGQQHEAHIQGWELTLAFAKAVINSIQTEAFPAGLLVRMIKGINVEKEMESYVVNVTIACFTAALLIVLILICITVFLRHEYRRRKKDVYLLKKPYMRDKPFNICLIISYIGTTLSLIYIFSLTIVSTNLHFGINVIDETVNGAMSDITTYFNTTKNQYNFVTTQTNNWFNEELMGGDMYRIGELIWQPGRDTFRPNLASIFSSLSDLEERTKNARGKLDQLHSKITSITSELGGPLATKMQKIHYDLTSVRKDWTCQGCDGSCTSCKNIDPDDIFYQVDLRKLPDITSNVERLRQIADTPFTNTMQNPEYYYDKGIAAVITERAAPGVRELNNTIDSYSLGIKVSTTHLRFPTPKDMLFPMMRENFKPFDSRLVVTDSVRFGFTWVVVFVNFVGVLITYLALTLTVKGKREGRRGGNPNFYPPYLLFMGSIGGCLILSLVFMCLAMMTFYGGVNMEKVICEPGKKLQYIDMVMDTPNLFKDQKGYFASKLILGDGNQTLKFGDMYRSCQKNKGAYSVLHHHLLVPSIFTDIDNTQHFRDVGRSFDKMHVSLSGTSLVSRQFTDWINNFVSAAYFNHSVFESMLTADVVKADMDAYIANIRSVLRVDFDGGGPTHPATDRLQRIADELDGVKPELVMISGQIADINQAFREFKTEVDHIRNVSQNAVKKLASFDSRLLAETPDLIKTGVEQYEQEFLHTFATFANQSQHWIHELGKCRPMSDAYDAVVYGFCDMISDFENCEWMLVGNNAVTLLFLLVILSIVLYYLPDDDNSDDTTDEFETIFGKGPPKGIINKALYKVSCLFIKRRPSNGIRKPGSSAGESAGSNQDPLIKDGDNMEMKNMPNGNIVNSKSDKSLSPNSERVVSPRTHVTDSTASLDGSTSTPSLDTDTKSGTSGSTNKSKGIILVNPATDAPSTGSASRPNSVVISEVHPRPRDVDLTPNIDPIDGENFGGRTLQPVVYT